MEQKKQEKLKMAKMSRRLGVGGRRNRRKKTVSRSQKSTRRPITHYSESADLIIPNKLMTGPGLKEFKTPSRERGAQVRCHSWFLRKRSSMPRLRVHLLTDYVAPCHHGSASHLRNRQRSFQMNSPPENAIGRVPKHQRTIQNDSDGSFSP